MACLTVFSVLNFRATIDQSESLHGSLENYVINREFSGYSLRLLYSDGRDNVRKELGKGLQRQMSSQFGTDLKIRVVMTLVNTSSKFRNS